MLKQKFIKSFFEIYNLRCILKKSVCSSVDKYTSLKSTNDLNIDKIIEDDFLPEKRISSYNETNTPIMDEKLLNDYKMKKFFDLEQNFINQTIKNVEDINELFALVRLYRNSLETSHIAKITENIYFIGRSKNLEKNDQFILKVLNNPDFKLLCKLIIQNIRDFKVDEILSIFRALTFLNVNPSTLIMRTTFQMIRSTINEFNIEEIILLDNLISILKRKNYKANNLLDALNAGLSFIIEVKIHNKEINFENINIISKCLFIASLKDISGSKINQLLMAISLMPEKIQLDHALIILKSLSNLSNDSHLDLDLAKDVIKICNNLIYESIKENDEKANNILLRLYRLYSSHYPNNRFSTGIVYDQELYKLVCKKVISVAKNEKLLYLYRLLVFGLKNDHIDVELLKHFYKKIVDSEIDKNFSIHPDYIYHLFANLPNNYLNFDLNYLIKKLENLPTFNLVLNDTEKLTNFVKDLVITNQFENEKIYNDFFNVIQKEKNNLKVKIINSLRHILIGLLSNNLPNYFNEYKSLINECVEIVKKNGIENNKRKKNMDLVISNIIDDSNYLKMLCFTSVGHFLHYCVIYDTKKEDLSEFPCNFNTNSIDKIVLPENCKLIYLNILNNKSYLIEPKIPKNIFNFIETTLLKLGIYSTKIYMDDLLKNDDKKTLIFDEIKKSLKTSNNQN